MMSRKLHRPCADGFQTSSRTRRHSTDSLCRCRARCSFPPPSSFSPMYTLGRCRRGASNFRSESRAMAWSTNDVISLSRRVHVVGVVSMGVSLPRSRALLRFSPSLPRIASSSSRSCFYFELFPPTKARIDKVFRSAVDPVDPSELPRSPTKFKGFFASNRQPRWADRSWK